MYEQGVVLRILHRLPKVDQRLVKNSANLGLKSFPSQLYLLEATQAKARKATLQLYSRLSG